MTEPGQAKMSIIDEECGHEGTTVSWTIAQAKQRFSALVKQAANCPQLICNRNGLGAATARIHGLTLATRNTRHFDGCGVALLNPFEHAVSLD
jgi:hypothetical protein